MSGGSNNETFDCGASSGYGSPNLTGTPLASPALNSTAYQLQKMLLDQGFCENLTQISPRNRFNDISPSLVIGNGRIEKPKFGTIGTGFGVIQEKVFILNF